MSCCSFSAWCGRKQDRWNGLCSVRASFSASACYFTILRKESSRASPDRLHTVELTESGFDTHFSMYNNGQHTASCCIVQTTFGTAAYVCLQAIIHFQQRLCQKPEAEQCWWLALAVTGQCFTDSLVPVSLIAVVEFRWELAFKWSLQIGHRQHYNLVHPSTVMQTILSIL